MKYVVTWKETVWNRSEVEASSGAEAIRKAKALEAADHFTTGHSRAYRAEITKEQPHEPSE